MSAVPAARYLADFSPDGDDGAIASGAPIEKQGSNSVELDEAFARGVEAGRAEANGKFLSKLQEQQGEFAARLEAQRLDWAAKTGENLANRLLEAVADFERRVAETVARILKPFISAELHRQAVTELQANLEALLATDSGVSISIAGPADLLDVLRQRLSGRAANVTYTPSDDCDVRIVAGPATLETQLRSWQSKLDEAVR